VAADLEQSAMELRVLIRHAEEVVGLAKTLHLGQDRFEAVDVPRYRSLGGEARGESLEHGTCLLDLDGLAELDETNPRPPVSLVFYEPLMLKPHERGAHDRATDAERAG
jgi:hypothetical protein